MKGHGVVYVVVIVVYDVRTRRGAAVVSDYHGDVKERKDFAVAKIK